MVLVAAATVRVETGRPLAQGGSASPRSGSGSCSASGGARTERVDVGTDGAEVQAPILRAALSANGRFVAFSSAADNVVPNDTNGEVDVFVRDLRRRLTMLVSVSSAGEQGNRASFYPSISADGRFVAFRSYATNLVEGDDNRVEDVFVHDRLTGETERVSVGPGGREADGPSITSSISADGSIVAFSSEATNLVPEDWNGARDVFVRDRVHERTIRVSVGYEGEADGASEASSLSADGHVVGFRSFASNLVPHDSNRLADTFVRDWTAGVTERVNVSSSGKQANRPTFRVSVSGDGRWVAFRSRASNLVRGDTNNALDVFEHDRRTGKTTRVSVATGGAQADSHGLGWSARSTRFMSRPFLSRDGRFAAFGSRAANLVAGDTNGEPDVFVHDLRTGKTVRVSVSARGRQANEGSYVAGISANGRVVAFLSSAANLVRGDTNRDRDVFVRVRGRREAASAACGAGTDIRADVP